MTLLKPCQLLPKVIAVCERNGILAANFQNNVILNIKYGPLGILLKRNVHREWLSSCLNNVDVPMLPFHIFLTHTVHSDHTKAKDLLLQEILHQYKNTKPFISSNLPYALAVDADQVSNGEDESNTLHKLSSEDFLWKLGKWTSLCIAFFCDPKKAMYWFHYWQRQRYVWWRKLSTNPSHFSMSDVVQNSSVNRQLSLQLQLPWGISPLETISEMNANEVAAGFCDPSDSKSTTLPSVLLCNLDLDFAVMAYLLNAFEEKLHMGKRRTVLKLHHCLAPYKVTVIVESLAKDTSKKLLDICSSIIQDLKKSNVAVLPNWPSDQITLQEQFDRFDAMGVPYTVVLCESTLTSGIAGLRNRDTTLQEKVHLTEIKSKIISYLQMSVGNR